MASHALRLLAIRRGAAAASVAALALVGLAAPAGAATDTAKAPTFDTYKDWDGGSAVAEFGNPDTSTYGQVITVPAGKKQVKWFTFYMQQFRGAGTMVFRGEVYGWDGTKATNPVWESKPVHFTPDATFQAVKFKAKKAKVKAGQQYVLFASVSKDYEQSAPDVTNQWANVNEDDLPGGYVVFLNDTGDESQWTTQAWTQIPSIDFAFQATLK